MRQFTLIAVAGFALALTACSKAEQTKTEDSVHDAAADVAKASREVAQSPAVEKAGENLKEAAHDTGTVLKHAAAGAVSGAKEGMAKAENDQKTADEGTTTTTTTTTVKTTKK